MGPGTGTAGAVGRDTTRSGTTRADTARADTARTDTTRADTTRADTAAADTAGAQQPDTVIIGTALLEDAGSLTARMDVRRGGGLQRTEFPNLWRSADLTGRYHIFLDLADRSTLRTRLTGDTLVTVLAPTDRAFARLSAGELARLRGDTVLLDAWLESLMLDGSLGSGELVEAGTLTSRGGALIRFSRADGVIHAGPARLVQPDLVARNGTLHGVDRVVLPEIISASP